MGAVGVSLVKEHEGLRTAAYIDPVGIPTICYGHTGPEVRLGLRYTAAKCEVILLNDIATHRKGLAKCVHVPLTRNQWDGLTSFAFNVGVSKACRSTMVRKVNAGDIAGASAEFPKWRYAGGQALPGLITRRRNERALFDAPVAYERTTVVARYAHLAD